MLRVPRDRYVFAFEAGTEPVLSVDPGDEVLFETLDSWAGRLRCPEDILTVPPDSTRANPAAGPVYVRGAQPGDTLVAEVLAVTPLEPVLSKIVAFGGLLAGEVASPYLRFISIADGELVFPFGIRLPLRPMVGVIGTAPAEGRLATADPGDHGGNMDHNHIAAGTKVYLPVGVPGALFALGDVHASMGDGEVAGAGLDCYSNVRVRLDVVRRFPLRRPFLETADSWLTCASAPSLQEALRVATRDMVAFLAERLGISREDAFLLVSAQGDIHVGQACGSSTDATARMEFPRLGGSVPA